MVMPEWGGVRTRTLIFYIHRFVSGGHAERPLRSPILPPNLSPISHSFAGISNLKHNTDAHFWLLIAAHFRAQLIPVVASCVRRDKQPPLNLNTSDSS